MMFNQTIAHDGGKAPSRVRRHGLTGLGTYEQVPAEESVDSSTPESPEALIVHDHVGALDAPAPRRLPLGARRRQQLHADLANVVSRRQGRQLRTPPIALPEERPKSGSASEHFMAAAFARAVIDPDQALIEKYASQISANDLAIIRALMGSMSSAHGDPDPAEIYDSYK